MANRYYLRPEALPLAWSDLDSSQKWAFSSLVHMLAEAQRDLMHRPTEAQDADRTRAPKLDFSRKSRMAFLSGGRGTGKTTVLVSLIWAFHSPERSRTELPTSVQQEFDALTRNLVWLDPLDMAPLPKASNLFAAILARIDNAIVRQGLRQEEANSPSSVRTRGLLEPAAPYRNALANLRRLQADAAIAWGSNLIERAGHLDPSSYAEEVLRTEQVRLAINERLDRALDDLAKDVFRAVVNRDPLFVMPVDDFDLNPLRCLELLHLLRTISVPRLFFLMCGDDEVAELTYKIQMAGDIADLARNAPQANFLPVTSQEVAGHIAHVAGSALQKLVPPAQRLRLQPVSTAEALGFRPVLRSPDILPSIKSLMEGWLLPLRHDKWTSLRMSKRGVRSLADFLLTPSLSIIRSEHTGAPVAGQEQEAMVGIARRSAYEAINFLQTSPRQLTDLWLRLQGTIVRLGTGELIRLLSNADTSTPYEMRAGQGIQDLFRAYWQETVASEPGLTPLQRHKFADKLDLDDFFLRAYVGPGREVASSHFAPAMPIAQSLRVRLIGSWEWARRPPDTTTPPSEQAPDPAISPATSRLFILTSDLLSLENPGTVRNESLRWLDNPSSFWLASTEWRGSRSISYAWPGPPLTTFWEYDLFLSGWRSAIDASWNLRSASVVIPFFVFAWVDLGAAVLTGLAPIGLRASTPPTAKDWIKLHRRLTELLADAVGDDLARAQVRDWLARISVLFSPEVIGHHSGPWDTLNEGMLSALWSTQGAAYIEHNRSRFTESDTFEPLLAWITSSSR